MTGMGVFIYPLVPPVRSVHTTILLTRPAGRGGTPAPRRRSVVTDGGPSHGRTLARLPPRIAGNAEPVRVRAAHPGRRPPVGRATGRRGADRPARERDRRPVPGAGHAGPAQGPP